MDPVETYLQKVPIFSGLSPAELEKIAHYINLTKFPAGQAIFDYGDIGASFFIIKEGLVKVFTTNPDGKIIILSIMGANEFFGEMALFDDSPRSASVETIADTETFILSKTHFQRLLIEMPSISWKMLSILANRLRYANEKLDNLIYHNVEDRLIKTLRNLAHKHGQKNNQQWTIPFLNFTHQELGQLIGTNRETITRCLCKLQQEGKIIFSNNNIIVN